MIPYSTEIALTWRQIKAKTYGVYVTQGIGHVHGYRLVLSPSCLTTQVGLLIIQHPGSSQSSVQITGNLQLFKKINFCNEDIYGKNN